jgi:hypothetical protein
LLPERVIVDPSPYMVGPRELRKASTPSTQGAQEPEEPITRIAARQDYGLPKMSFLGFTEAGQTLTIP